MLYRKIEKICRDRGTNISRLEKECGIGNGTIRGWEKSKPRIDNLVKVADYLGVPIQELISEDAEAEKEEV